LGKDFQSSTQTLVNSLRISGMQSQNPRHPESPIFAIADAKSDRGKAEHPINLCELSIQKKLLNGENSFENRSNGADWLKIPIRCWMVDGGCRSPVHRFRRKTLAE
jgi:hypothetical protein